jgi:hypothetical protein
MEMGKIDSKVAALFKKAYYYNWDDGLPGLKKILASADCDLATATMIFWHGTPDFYYNPKRETDLNEVEKAAFGFLKAIADMILAGKFPLVIGYVVEEAFLPKELGNIPAALARPIEGAADYRTVLWPNTNPFQDQILVLCQRCDSPDALSELARQGADFSLKILNGYAYPLQVAVNYGQVEAVKYFAERGYDLKAKFNKNPLLFGAVSNGHLPMIEFLLHAGVDPNQKSGFGNTALHYIAGSIETLDEVDDKILAAAQCLLANGANHGLRNSQKKTPLDLALELGDTAYIELLQSLESE